MKVIDIMTAPVQTVQPSTPIMTALQALARHRVTSLPVVAEDRRVVGIVSEQDLLRSAMDAPMADAVRARRRDLDDAPLQVREVMTSGPHTVHPEADVADVAHIFSLVSWKALPVVRDGRLVGIISRSDLVRAITRDDQAVQRDLERLCTTTGHDGWRVRVRHGVAEIIGTRDYPEQVEATRLARSIVGVRRVDVARG